MSLLGSGKAVGWEAAQASPRVAITGVHSFLGDLVAKRLRESLAGDALLGLDLAPSSLGIPHRTVDLTEPTSDQTLLDLFREEGVRHVLHFAFHTTPQRDSDHAHELESIGTLNLLAAAAAAGVEHVILRSYTAVYGADGRHPNFLTEHHEIKRHPALKWLREKAQAEGHALVFARRYPKMRVSVLRFAPLLGPGVRSFYTRVLDRRVIPVLMGYDPLLQLLHPEDAVDAVMACLERAPAGAVNVVPRDSIALLTLLHLAGKIPLPIPHPLAYATADALWGIGVGPAPAGFLDYVRYLFVADGAKARAEMGFEARHRSRDALEAYVRYRHPGPASSASMGAARAEL